MDSFFLFPVVAKIVWTPATFFVAMAVVQTLLILIGFRMFDLEEEHRTVLSAAVGAVVINGVAYFMRDHSALGVIVHSVAIFGVLIALSSGSIKATFSVMAVMIVIYGAASNFVMERTDLLPEDFGGIVEAIAIGGVEAEPLTETY